MSAIEIAEQFEKHWGDFPSEVAAYMLSAAQYLRKQQTEIEALKAKTLTDEEIYKIANSIETIQPQHGLRLSNDLNVMEFARAILRKAQEK